MKRMIMIAAVFAIGCAKRPSVSPIEETRIEPPNKTNLQVEARPDSGEVLALFDIAENAPQGAIYFDLNSDAVIEPYKINKVAEYLESNPTARITVVGHACPLGEVEHNFNLGERRAVAVKAYLVNKYNADPYRIDVWSEGEEKPVSLDPVFYHQNRRVEIVVIPKEVTK